MTIKYTTANLPFCYPFTISKGTKSHQPTFIVSLNHFGLYGLGEAPAIAYYHIPTEKMITDLEQKKIFIEKFAFYDPERFWHFLHHLFPDNPFLVCALDMAGWDLFGKIKKKSLTDLWALQHDKAPITDYTIGIDTIDNMRRKMEKLAWPVYKIKVGFENDVETIAALRKYSKVPFRLDANAAWSVEVAKEKITEFNSLGIELIEQPLAKDDWAGMKELYNWSPLPLIADESCVGEHDVIKCHLHFHGINIKLTKCSGITPARRMIEKAKELNMKVMLGCMNESTIGSAAIAHLSPLADYLDADGPLLLKNDLAAGLTYENGKIIVTNQPGLGVELLTPF